LTVKKYNINPNSDMIIATMGTGSNPIAMAQGRIRYALRYYGVDRKKLAILNGGNQWIHRNGMIGADFQAARSREPNVSVNGLLADNIQLQATIGDMLPSSPAPTPT